MTIAEGVAGYAVTQVSGMAQTALLAFFILYALSVTLVFFLFLWHKPANFYAPSEYGSLQPGEYARGLAGLPSETAVAVEEMRLNPLDEDAIFKILDTLLPEETKQHLILMSRNNGQIHLPEPDENGFTHKYEIISRNQSVSIGLFSPRKFFSKLNGTQLITNDQSRNLYLTDRGKRFANWQIKHERDAETFKSDIGNWGKEQTVSDVMSKQIEAHNQAVKQSNAHNKPV